MQFLTTAFEEKHEGKTIVISHHVPTYMNYPEKYKHSEVTEVFAVEMHDFIEKTNADYWIYGHHHMNIPAFKIARTQLINNQLGYINQKENAGFANEAYINL